MNPGAVRLDQLAVEDFAGLIAAEFAASVEEGGPPIANLVLTEARASGTAVEGCRQPFSLIFEGPPDICLQQDTYFLGHPHLGALGVFLVPISGDAERRRYQAIFN